MVGEAELANVDSPTVSFAFPFLKSIANLASIRRLRMDEAIPLVKSAVLPFSLSFGPFLGKLVGQVFFSP